MLILLPPSESKALPTRGKVLHLETLSHPELTPTRARLLSALIDVCRSDPETARRMLGLTAGQSTDIVRNAGLLTAPTAPAGRIYTGVLYDALDLASLTPAAKRRAASRVLVTSALFGVVRLADRIPSYRLSGSASLPGVGTIASAWRQPLDAVLVPAAERGLVVDLRSGTYASFWRPPAVVADRVVAIRVLQETAGVRTVVSHFNKATKGRLVAQLLEDGANPASTRGLVRLLSRLGWIVEPTPGRPGGIDVIVTELH